MKESGFLEEGPSTYCAKNFSDSIARVLNKEEIQVKVTAFNGSPRVGGNTEILIKKVLTVLEQEGIETEFIQLGGQKLSGCTACGSCYRNKNNRCIIDDDKMNFYIEKMVESDGIIIGSPTYFSNVSTEVKALIDRAGFVARANGCLRRKVGAAVVAVRRAGSIHTFNSINNLFLINQMIIPGSSYWNMGLGRGKGEVEGDEEGMETMKVLGENMAWLLKKINR